MSDDVWTLQKPLPNFADPHIGRSPHVCEDCGHHWIYGPFAWVLMHYCHQPQGDRRQHGMIYSDYALAAHDLDQLRVINWPPTLTVIDGQAEPPALAAAS